LRRDSSSASSSEETLMSKPRVVLVTPPSKLFPYDLHQPAFEGLDVEVVTVICRDKAEVVEAVRGADVGMIGGFPVDADVRGAIGQALARRLQAFGLQVIAHDPQVEAMVSREVGVRMVLDLPALLGAADYVSVQVPFNARTRHLLGEREFRAMKPTAFFVNCCRGGVVDERALVRALREGWIAGAGLDVFEQEPTDPANPLLQLDNVIATPHAAGESTESGAASTR